LHETRSCDRRFLAAVPHGNLPHVEPIAVLVVDRERAVAQAVARRLDREHGLVVVGSAHTAVGAITAAERDRPDVIVFDEGVVDGELVDVLGRLIGESPRPGTRLVVTSDDADPARAYESIRAGASAFVSKSDGVAEMVATILGVASGETHIAPLMLSEVLERFRAQRSVADAPGKPLPHLTDREREVLECLTAGLDRAETARRLGVSVHTVRTHTQSVYAKLEVHSSVEAVSVATRAGLLGSRVSA
jgi:DNA-binding NarL/FixJ family response regulator